MPKIHVLIVDGSVVIRRLLTDALSQDPEILVVGSADPGSNDWCRFREAVPGCPGLRSLHSQAN